MALDREARDLSPPRPDLVDRLLRRALREDLGRRGDLTSQATLPSGQHATARIVVRERGCLAGVDAALRTFALLDPAVVARAACADGSRVDAGTEIATVAGPVRSLLAAERTAMNVLGHLGGIATATRAMVEAVAASGARICDTRKTTPGLRVLEKYAVRCGGGVNHRFGLDDAILIKDNHVAAAGSVTEALRRARSYAGHMVRIEVEVDDLDQLREALDARAEVVLLDNFTTDQLRDAVAMAAGEATLEASGRITLANVREIADTGVDLISAGWITHSAPALDVAMEISAPHAM